MGEGRAYPSLPLPSSTRTPEHRPGSSTAAKRRPKRDPDASHDQPTEATMSSTQMHSEHATQIPRAGTVDMKLEVIVLSVSDVDAAKRFYQRLGWRLDADFATGEDWRGGQLTPPRSPCSSLFGKGITTAVPGSGQGKFLIVADIAAARAGVFRRHR